MTAVPGEARATNAAWAVQPDNEHQMAVNRLVITTVLFAGAVVFGHADDSVSIAWISCLYLLYVSVAAAVLLHVLYRPEVRRWRIMVAMTMDICTLSYVNSFVGPSGVGFVYPGYLLIIYGYGFRYGVRWLTGAAAISVAQVAVVFLVSPAWVGHGMMAGGLLVGLIIIPIYAYRLVRNLWQAKAQAEEANHAKSMFIAAISHDLRTPLNAIIGLGDILATSKTSPEDADMARMIGDSGRALLTQIDSILDFSRLEMGRAPLTIERIDLVAMLHGVRELLDVSARAKGVRLGLTIEMPIPRYVRSSSRHIRDSLNNLVGNAIKFTASGSVDIDVRKVGEHNGGARLRFEVRDTGIGISRKAQQHIFERFTQADDTIHDNYGGSGLGLAIVKQLVHALGGDIGVTSSQGKGSVFWFELDLEPTVGDAVARPVANTTTVVFSKDPDLIGSARRLSGDVRVESTLDQLEYLCRISNGERLPPIILDTALCSSTTAETLDRAVIRERLARGGMVLVADKDHACCTTPCAAGCSARVQRPIDDATLSDSLFLAAGAGRVDPTHFAIPRDASILVAEDNKTNQKVIAKMLSLSGRRATLVSDGREALIALAEGAFDVVLMDINMPGVNGVEATRRLREMEQGRGRRTPVIALTADVTPETRARCVAAGMDDCLTKPIDLPRLLAAIDHWAAPRAPGRIDPDAEQRETDTDHASPAPIEMSATLADLETLGGKDFVREIATQFVSDAALLLKSLDAAVRDDDVLKFRDEAHALRSCSANVGARSIYQLCLSWREIGAAEFAAEGAAHVAELEREFARAREQLSPLLDSGRAA